MNKPRLATCWLDGCSGCHMSMLDMDERLIEIAQRVQFVYGPYVDAKVFPENVDVAIVEGAVSSDEDLHTIRKIRANTKILVSIGDCGITGNVPAMRNASTPAKVMAQVYDAAPTKSVPRLLEKCRPIHEVVKVDLFIPGCPPSAQTIKYALTELLDGRIPDLSGETRFGA